MKDCQTKLLAELPDANVVKCKQSGLVRWYYKNVMVSFKEEDFMVFTKSFSQIDFDKKGWVTEEGNRFVIINTCHRDIQFVFKEHEHRKIISLFEKARTELEILNILKN
jgi:hypothetical protein